MTTQPFETMTRAQLDAALAAGTITADQWFARAAELNEIAARTGR